MPVPSIETSRLLLRGPESQDYAVYRDFFANGEASRFYGGPLPPDGAWRVLASDLGHWQLRGYGRWSVIERASGRMVGSCGLWWPEGYPRSELTWWILPEFRRLGMATEASNAAIAFGYRVLGWSMVETHMNDANEPARGLVEKLGGTRIARDIFPDGLERNIYMLPERPTREDCGQ